MQFKPSTRREFITLLGSTATWPLAARAQQPALPVFGLLSSRAKDQSARLLVAFHRGLNESGYVESQKTWRLSIAGRRVNTTNYLRWRMIWFAVR
jgi:hypothetical protein